MSSYFSDDEDLDVRIRHHTHSPDRVRYVGTPREYYGSPSYLRPEQRTMIVARSRSRERSRERTSPPQPAGPVIIHNKIYNDLSDDEYDVHPRRRRQSSYSRSRSRSHGRYMSKEDWQIEHDRRELERMRLDQAREDDERRANEKRDGDAELRRAKEELDSIKQREARAEDEKRIKRQLELQRLKEEERAAAERALREKEAAAAVEKYKKEEVERREKEAKKKAEDEKEYKRRLQEDLLKSGLDEKYINAILKNETVQDRPKPGERPVHMRMPRKHLSIETLRTFRVEFEIDKVWNHCHRAVRCNFANNASRTLITLSSNAGFLNGSKTSFGSILNTSERKDSSSKTGATTTAASPTLNWLCARLNAREASLRRPS